MKQSWSVPVASTWVFGEASSMTKLASTRTKSHRLIHKAVQNPAAATAALSASSVPAAKIELKEGQYIFDPDFNYTGSLRAVYPLSDKREVPAHIPRPDYVDHPEGESMKEAEEGMREASMMRRPSRLYAAKVHTPEEIAGMREVCKLGRKVLNIAAAAIKPGITTDELDAIVHAECLKRDAYPSPLGYRKFPKSVCTSVNEVICHGIPDQRELLDGDIVNLDVSLFYKGFHGDLNATYPVGNVDQASLDLMATSKESLRQAISICKPGVAFAEIGNVIESVVKPKGYGIVTRYTGHGINQLVRAFFRFHCGPNILHYGKSKMPGFMKEGNIFTIEPMINAGASSLIHWSDDWTAATRDGKRSAQFEETILITATGAEILTDPKMPKKKK
ncbi:methionine aminopeptidase [Phaffia rhodozyma]|uniref:Methionine aminopeptidase n=1 Tax=Phaffia rhodozyma TaxID=264483 RepID=A0A0F7STT0_PHARH|nr:methionine aminopeptidase [Phaffia rhodozyma]